MRQTDRFAAIHFRCTRARGRGGPAAERLSHAASVHACVRARSWPPCSSCVCHRACHHSHRFHDPFLFPSLFPPLRNAFLLLCLPALSLCRCAPQALRLAPGVSDGHGGASCRQPSPPITACSTGNKLTTPPSPSPIAAAKPRPHSYHPHSDLFGTMVCGNTSAYLE